MFNEIKSPIDDAEKIDFLSNKPLNFRATLNQQDAFKNDCDIIITNRASL